MDGAQQIAMQLILVNESLRSTNLLSTVPVPIRPGSVLSSLTFSTEGMLISQDSSGNLRVFSLERGDWTSVGVSGLEDKRKVWIIGVDNH